MKAEVLQLRLALFRYQRRNFIIVEYLGTAACNESYKSTALIESTSRSPLPSYFVIQLSEYVTGNWADLHIGILN